MGERTCESASHDAHERLCFFEHSLGDRRNSEANEAQQRMRVRAHRGMSHVCSTS